MQAGSSAPDDKKAGKEEGGGKACSEFLTGGKEFFGAPLSATTLFSGKKVHRLLNTHEKYLMHHSRPEEVLQERRQLQDLLQF